MINTKFIQKIVIAVGESLTNEQRESLYDRLLSHYHKPRKTFPETAEYRASLSGSPHCQRMREGVKEPRAKQVSEETRARISRSMIKAWLYNPND